MYKNKIPLIAALSALLLAGCATAPKYKYGAAPGDKQFVTQAKLGDASIPRLVSNRKNIVMAEPRAVACDGATEFAFNVVIANRQSYPIQVAPTDFSVSYMGRTFPSMTEKQIEKEIHSGDWFKNSMLAVGIVGAIAGVATGNLAGAESLLGQAGANYESVSAQQDADFAKYRNKVFAATTIQPKAIYGGLVVAQRDQSGKDYSFDAANASADINLQVNIDGETDTLSFTCNGVAPPPSPVTASAGSGSTAQ